MIVENFGDAPFFKSEVPSITLTAMTRVVSALRFEGATLGINVLRNDALGALSVAAVTEAAFIRVNVHTGAMLTDQGIIEGRAAEVLRRRAALAPSCQIWADIHVKHAQPLAHITLAQAAEETFGRGGADALIVTGAGTGKRTSLDEVKRVKDAVPRAPVLVGSGVTAATVVETLSVADGVIVGSDLKVGGDARQPVELDRARHFFETASAR